MNRLPLILIMIFLIAMASAIGINNPELPMVQDNSKPVVFDAPVIAQNNVNVNQGVSISTASTQPSCTSANRGQFWVVQGTLGVADVLYVCRKSALDTYGWGVVTLS